MNKLINALLSTFFFLAFINLSINASAQAKRKSNLSINQRRNFSASSDRCNYLLELHSVDKQRILSSSRNHLFKDTIIYISGGSPTLKINTKRNVTLNINDDKIVSVKILLSQVDTLKINGRQSEKISIYNVNKEEGRSSKANFIMVNNSIIDKANFRNVKIGSLIFKKSELRYLDLKNSVVSDMISFKQVRLDSANFDFALLPPLITLDTVDLSYVNGTIDMSRLLHISADSSYTHQLSRTLRISDTDLDKIKLSYDRFNFHIDTLQGIVKRAWIYQKILKNLKNNHLTDSYDYYSDQLTAARDEMNHGILRNKLNEIWWNNGQNRRRVVYNSLGIFLFFFIINCFLYRWLKVIYMPEMFKEYYLRIEHRYLGYHTPSNQRVYIALYALGVFIYTSYIFWGLKLNLNTLKIKFIPLFSFIIFQYLMGLICVAYIIGIIIVK